MLKVHYMYVSLLHFFFKCSVMPGLDLSVVWMTDASACGRIELCTLVGLHQCHSITFSRPGFRTYVLIFESSPSTILQQNFRLVEFRTRIGFLATTTHV